MIDHLVEGFNATFLAFLVLAYLIIRYGPDYIKSWRRLKQQHSMTNGMRAMMDVFAAMDRIHQSSLVSRVLLLEISNGGDVPQPGSKMYASSVAARNKDESLVQVMMSRYEKVRLDEEYIRMCIHVLNGEIFKCRTSDMPKGSILKDFYEMEGIVYGEIYHIYTDVGQKRMFIMSICSNEFEDFSQIRGPLNAEVTEIRNKFDKYRHS